MFAIVLILAAWQDFRYRYLERWFLIVFGLLGLAYSICSDRTWQEAASSVMIGVLLLFLSRITGGEIGEGDGWFFIVTGLYLSLLRNLILLLSGLFFSSIFSLVLIAMLTKDGGGIRKIRIPFIPFLLPMGLWFMLV